MSGTASATLPGLPDHLDRVAELGPDAREEQVVVVDEHDAALHDGLLGRWSSTSVPFARARHDRRPAAGALHPPLDRLGDALAIGRDGRGVEARAAVAHEHAHRVVRHLDVDVDLLDARELGGVRHRLPCREHERAHGRVDGAVAGARELDPHAVELLDVAGRRLQRRDEGRGLVAERVVGVEPAAELALLPAAPATRHGEARSRGAG